MFEWMEITKKIYKGGETSKNTPLAEADCDSSGRNKKGRASTLTYNGDQGCTGKLKRSNAVHPIDKPTWANKTCLLYGPRHPSEECKLICKYTDKGSAQLTYQYKQSRSIGNERSKTVNSESAAEEYNIMKYHDEPIPRKKKLKIQNKKPMSDQYNADLSEDGSNYGLDRLNLG